MLEKSKQILQKTYYQRSDGVYESYWFGKFINMLIRAGKKKIVVAQLIKVVISLKFSTAGKVLSTEFFLEGLESIKPSFMLSYVIIAGKRREFPRFLSRHKQFQLSLQWLCELIANRKELRFEERLLNEYLLLNRRSKHSLNRRRDLLLAQVVANRFNTRFSY